ncbi:MAG: metal ABC transporter ATP-binding protein [Treponema sp.]|nr:metal ABC transporter ATP-binding protein [Treponema sp.]
MALIKCKNLVWGYNGSPIAASASFEVNRGDYLCIVGENGSGKSTLIKTLLGLEKSVSGVFEFSDGLSRRDIGYLPQQSAIQKDFPASVWEIVLSGTLNKIHLKPFYTKKEKLMAEEALEKMEIKELRDKCYRNLSGGQQQRVLLARCLCAASKVIFLDEPVTGLDPKAMNEMYKLISRLNDDGVTVMMISHDVDEAVKYASHILTVGKDHCHFQTVEDYLSYHEKHCRHDG